MKEILMALIAAGLGCWIAIYDFKLEQRQKHCYQEICVDGVVYLRSGNGYLTPKVNKDFYPYVCAIKKERNNG